MTTMIYTVICLLWSIHTLHAQEECEEYHFFTGSFLEWTTTKNPGETICFRGRSSLSDGQTVQFVKLGAVVTNSRAKITMGFNRNATVLATFDQLDPLLAESTDRYSVEGTYDGIAFDLTATITDIQVEDYGTFTWRILNEDGSEASHSARYSVRVLGPITLMAIIYKDRKESRADLQNDTEIHNEDGILSYVDNDESGGELVCVQGATTTGAIFWEMTLRDPITNTSVNVTDRFREDYTHSDVKTHVGGLYTFDVRTHYFARAPGYGPRFHYEDSGKILTFRAQVEGYEMQTTSTVLNIEFSPKESDCYPSSLHGPVGYKNFTVLCYTKSNPDPTVSWTVNDEALRQGIIVHNQKIDEYFVSMLIIDKLQEADFATYSFTAENKHGSQQTASNIGKTDTVRKATLDNSDLPWNEETNAAHTLTVQWTITIVSVLFGTLLFH